MKYVKSIIYLFVPILPIFTIVVLVYLFGYRFPYWDEILYLPLYDKLSQGTLSLNDLFFLQNNHRPFIPRLITLMIAKITSWNEMVILYCSVTSVIVLYIVLSYIINSEKKGKIVYRLPNYPKINIVKFFALCYTSLLLFSWSQMENWIWGLQLMVFITNLLCVLVLFVIFQYKMNILTLIICISLSTFASFSFANGLLIWFISLPILTYKIAKSKKNYMLLIIWVLCTIAVITFYFTNYQTPSISKTDINPGLLHKFLYFLLYCGSPISGFIFTPPWHGNKIPEVNTLSYLFGITGLVLWVLLLYKTKNVIVTQVQICKFEKDKQVLYIKRLTRPDIEEYFFWKGLSLFALLSGILLVLGRSGMGLGQALSSRYITTGCLFWCSLIGLFNFYVKNSEESIKEKIIKRYCNKTITGFILIVFLILNFSPVFLNREWHKIARWKNLGWYALSSGYNGRLYWTDLWGDKDFATPEVLQKELFPIFKKYNLASINNFESNESKKNLAKIFIKETKYFIKNNRWKPAVCYLDTAFFLDPELQNDIEELKKQIPPEMFVLYKRYQNEWQLTPDNY